MYMISRAFTMLTELNIFARSKIRIARVGGDLEERGVSMLR